MAKITKDIFRITDKCRMARLCGYRDLVEVVSCEDCKHWDKDTLVCNALHLSGLHEHTNWYADDFCSYGEKMDAEVE